MYLQNVFTNHVTLPTSAPVTSTSSNHFDILGRRSSSGPDRGITHFFTATSNTIQKSGRKRTNEQNEQYEPGVNSKCKTRSYLTLCIPVSIYRTNASVDFLRKFYNPWGVLTHLDSSSLAALDLILSDWSLCCPVSTALSVVRRQPPSSSSFSNSLLAFHYPLPVTPRSRVQNPLSGFAPKQTKKSSAWRTSYIVLHQNLVLNTQQWLCCISIMQLHVYIYTREHNQLIMTTSITNEYTSLQKYKSLTLCFRKRWCLLCVRNEWRQGRTAILTQALLSAIAVLLSHLGLSCSTGGH